MAGKLVLIVDDDPHILDWLNVLFRKHNIATLRVPSAQLALHLLHSIIPGLVLLDVMLPDANGIELCTTMRQMPHIAKTPIVMLTAYDRPQWRDRATAAGADAFLSKLDATSSLVDTVLDLLNDHHEERV